MSRLVRIVVKVEAIYVCHRKVKVNGRYNDESKNKVPSLTWPNIVYMPTFHGFYGDTLDFELAVECVCSSLNTGDAEISDCRCTWVSRHPLTPLLLWYSFHSVEMPAQ